MTPSKSLRTETSTHTHKFSTRSLTQDVPQSQRREECGRRLRVRGIQVRRRSRLFGSERTFAQLSCRPFRSASGCLLVQWLLVVLMPLRSACSHGARASTAGFCMIKTPGKLLTSPLLHPRGTCVPPRVPASTGVCMSRSARVQGAASSAKRHCSGETHGEVEESYSVCSVLHVCPQALRSPVDISIIFQMCRHNQTYKAHKNGIKRPKKNAYASRKGVSITLRISCRCLQVVISLGVYVPCPASLSSLTLSSMSRRWTPNSCAIR